MITDKKQHIINVALRCFADKGYQSTSIQEIADALGMAKGSLYFYFKSKADLLVSICKHHFEWMQKDYRSIIEDPQLSPREKLIQQIVQNYSYFAVNSDFIKLLMTERFESNDEIHQSIFALRAYSLVENQKCILELYGEKARSYSFDAATIYSAMSSGYMGYVVKEQMSLDANKVAHFIVDRLDDIVHGMIQKKTEPIMQEDEINKFMSENPPMGFKLSSGVEEDIRAIRELVDSLGLKPAKVEELEAALRLLETELDKPDPSKVVVKGMLALLKGYKSGAMKKHIANIEHYMK